MGVLKRHFASRVLSRIVSQTHNLPCEDRKMMISPIVISLLLLTCAAVPVSSESAIRVKKSVIRTGAEEGIVLVEVKDDSNGNVTVDTLVHSLYGDVDQYPNCSLPFILNSEEIFSCAFTVQLRSREEERRSGGGGGGPRPRRGEGRLERRRRVAPWRAHCAVTLTSTQAALFLSP